MPMMSEQPERFGRRVLREDVKEYLIDAILRGQLRAGEHIVEMRPPSNSGLVRGRFARRSATSNSSVWS